MQTLDLASCTVDLTTGNVTGSRQATLTPRELQLLRHLAQRPGQVVERQVLLTEVFGYGPNTLSRAVDKAMNSLRDKVEADPRRPDHLLTVRGAGYQFVLPTATPSVSPPLPLTDPFVGRHTERAQLQELLRTGCRLITLKGPGGSGKTRLVNEVLSADPRLRLCPIAQWTDLPSVLAQVERTLRILAREVEPAARIERIGRVLAEQAVVLVLDNAEHVASALSDAILAWRRAAPHATLVATSRVRLGLPGEVVLELGPLDRASARELFALRASRPCEDDPATGNVVDLLDRLPLAIELAARRARVLAVDELQRRLASSFDLLTTDAPVPDRQRDVLATVRWSWDLLDPRQQQALTQCTAFVGGFDLPAAEHVIALDAPAPSVLDVIQSLVDASLLRVRRDGRLDLYESVRQFAKAHLTRPDEVWARHADWYARLGTRLRIGARTDATAGCLARLEDELSNLRAVYEGNRTTPRERRVAARMAVHCWMRIRGSYPDRRVLLAEALRESTGLGGELRVAVLNAMVALDGYQASDDSLALLEEAEAIARGEERGDLLVRVLGIRAMTCRMARRLDQAQAALDAAETVVQHDTWAMLNLRFEQAALTIDRSEGARGADLLERVVHRSAEAGLVWLEAVGRLNLATLHRQRGQVAQSRDALARVQQICERLDSVHLWSLAALQAGLLELASGDHAEARTQLLRAVALARRHCARNTVAKAAVGLATIALSTGDPAEAERATAIGLVEEPTEQPALGVLTLYRAVALALLGRGAEARETLALESLQDVDPVCGAEVATMRPGAVAL
nr:winged helix-turn-helix domain-containing protein [Myxococcales bacterium]